MTPLWVALAGGLGAGVRFVADGLLTAHGHRFTATLMINVVGSFLLGVVVGWAGHEVPTAIIGVGFLGGFTTFSTASVDLVRLVRAERAAAAIALALAMVGLSVLAVLLGAGLGGLFR